MNRVEQNQVIRNDRALKESVIQSELYRNIQQFIRERVQLNELCGTYWGCRTSNGADINAEPGTNPRTKDGRGNIAPTTIIMPTVAMEADRDVEKFMTLLDQKIHGAKDSLVE